MIDLNKSIGRMYQESPKFLEQSISPVVEPENYQYTSSAIKDAKSFKELELGIYELIELSNVPEIYKIKGARMWHSKFTTKLNNRSFKPHQLLGILRAIIEHSNYEIIRNKNAGHITQ